ncbi:CPBP family intramembrane glutamic endopeptidase [Aquimarina litoralis]|uniref:CPBP family intramembrane glutamic endopeptidase n=1 Tax=Aquimarina litoralis TaxID=584605 RepID=UPI001C56926F|nr:CPBP family intramembrane glutamic endopeptidase [Aquimarina litoralis]MBW1295062.1 CPBP family intramembrane metalloprotease [Aquimarina litoralis]
MHFKSLFFNNNYKLRALWRILLFISALLILISPLILINNSYLQFTGAAIILVLGLYFNSKYLDKIDFSDYGLIFRRVTFSDFSVGILFGFLSVILMLLIGMYSEILVVSKIKSALNVPTLLLFGLKMFLVGVLEETFFRGYLFTNIYDGFKSKILNRKQALLIALVLSSIFFGLAHMNTNNSSTISIVFLTINGIVWCIPFIITKNLGLSIGLHTAWNFTQTLIGFTMSGNKATNSFYRIENNGFDLMTGGGYGPEAGILGLIGYSLMLFLSLIYIQLIRKK